MKTPTKDYSKAILFIIFLFVMIGLSNSVKGQDIFKASTLLDKGQIYLSCYQGKLVKSQTTMAQFSLQPNRHYQVLKLIYIKGELISEESVNIKTSEAEMLYVTMSNTDKKKVSYLIILGYGGKTKKE
ncbi:hypothetical protein KAU11_10540 [Candidatus Babeliales bacterium]|nr:hypothetical protein [Candidatus Babeliales bacterium]